MPRFGQILIVTPHEAEYEKIRACLESTALARVSRFETPEAAWLDLTARRNGGSVRLVFLNSDDLDAADRFVRSVMEHANLSHIRIVVTGNPGVGGAILLLQHGAFQILKTPCESVAILRALERLHAIPKRA